VIENTQRDLNIALVNELSIIFERMGIDTDAVLQAAGTKWNFLPFRPGLVGGHCIGVDPYYLTHKAQGLGYHPEVILAGRRINDGMAGYVASRIVKALLAKRVNVANAKLLMLGLAFKENCPDIRNTKVVDLVAELRSYGLEVDVHDPWVHRGEAEEAYGFDLVEQPQTEAYDAVVLAVAHDVFKRGGPAALRAFGRERHVFCDLKSVFAEKDSDFRL
jgi:UDP-N-acetyl-D-galactosamine dehydrogenase